MAKDRSTIVKKLRKAVKKRGLERERKERIKKRKLQDFKDNFLTPREKLRLVKRKSKKKIT